LKWETEALKDAFSSRPSREVNVAPTAAFAAAAAATESVNGDNESAEYLIFVYSLVLT